jgi:hypothetical protein
LEVLRTKKGLQPRVTTSKVTPTGLAGLRLIAWPGSSTAAKLNFVHGLETTNFGLILHVDCPANIFRGSAVSELVPFKYRAFLSYSHRDKAWGKWLHAALEGYRIDKDLAGRAGRAGAEDIAPDLPGSR